MCRARPGDDFFAGWKVQKLPARLIPSELRAHQMAPGGVIAHWRSHRALELTVAPTLRAFRLLMLLLSYFILLRLATPALRLGVIAGSWLRSEANVLPYGSAGFTVVRRITLRVQVFLEFFYWLALTFAKAPDPFRGSRGDGHVASSLCTPLLPAQRAPARTLLLVAQSVPQVRAVPNCTARSVCIFKGIVTGAAGHNRGGVVVTVLDTCASGRSVSF